MRRPGHFREDKGAQITPILYNSPQGLGPWLTWGATHQSDHFSIADGIKRKKGLTVTLLPIDPVPLNNKPAMLTWFMNHQIMHNIMNAAMGLGGTDLSFVDFTKPDQSRVWLEYNALEHQAISAAIAAYQPPPPQQGQPSEAIMPQPQPETQVQPQSQALLPQGNPGVQTIQQQPNPAVQPQAATGPQPAEQPNPTLQPQPAAAPQPGQNPGTPLQPGSGGTMPVGNAGSGSTRR